MKYSNVTVIFSYLIYCICRCCFLLQVKDYFVLSDEYTYGRCIWNVNINKAYMQKSLAKFVCQTAVTYFYGYKFIYFSCLNNKL